MVGGTPEAIYVNPMSWIIAYFLIASAGLLVALAMFKVGGDADAPAPLIPPGCDAEDCAAGRVSASSTKRPEIASPDLPVVETGSIDLSLPAEKHRSRDEMPSSSSSTASRGSRKDEPRSIATASAAGPHAKS
jgi:hypothetical protein